MTAAAIVALLAEVSWRAIVVAALVGSALVVWRVRSGTARHAAWAAVMVVFLLMPLLLQVTPTVTVPVGAPFVLPVREPGAPAAAVPAGDTVGASAGPAVLAAARAPRAPDGPPSPLSVQPGPDAAASSSLSVEAWLLIVWLVGVAVSLVWLAGGWRWARRLAATGRVSEVDPRVYESAVVASPCAVGVWRGRVLVPATWRLWPAERRAMVVTHELAHLDRRDGLTALLARLTRAVFWFHPLSWWLERHIAAAAEQACDERVLRVGHDADRYAEFLLEMASAMRSSRGHAAWARAGMAGGRQMDRRLDRILAGWRQPMTPLRVCGAVATLCACVAVGVACRTEAPVLRPDPEVTRQIEDQRARQVRWESLKTMTKAEADALLQQFRANPGDLETAETLRWYYRTRWEGQMPWEEAREALRFVWLSTIERHPESPSSEWGLSAAEDPDGHAQAATLWDAHLTDSALSARAYRNAVRFIETTDPARAERLLIEAVTRYREPPLAAYASERGTETGKAGTEVWRSALGTLYARWASGAVRDHLGRPEIDEAAAASAFGRSARAALEVSTDAVLLTAAGQFLVSRIRGPNGEPGPAAPRELGYALLARALAIDPANDQARHWNDFERRLDDMRALRARVVERLGVEWNAATAAQVSTLPEEDQAELLPQLVSHHYSRAEMTGYYQKDQAGRMAQMATARDFAERALSVLRDRAAAGDRVAVDRLDDVEMLRGAIAWAFGDRERALRSLVATIDLAKASGEYALEIGTYARQNLTHALLTAGEIDAVATHHEQAAPLSGRDQPQHAAIAKALREGRMPANYQRQLAGAVQ